MSQPDHHRRYRQYVDSSDGQIDADRQTLLNTLLREARGYDNRLSARELAERTDINRSTLRDVIIELRSEFSVPIGNVGSGYFLIDTDAEAERVREYYDQEIETKRQRRDEILKCYADHETAMPDTDTDTDLDTADIRGEIRDAIRNGTDARAALIECVPAADDRVEAQLTRLERAGFVYETDGRYHLP